MAQNILMASAGRSLGFPFKMEFEVVPDQQATYPQQRPSHDGVREHGAAAVVGIDIDDVESALVLSEAVEHRR